MGRKALYSISGWLPARGAIISVSGTRGLKCPLFYFRSFGAKTDLASSCAWAIGSRAWPTSKKGIHAQTKECVWNGMLIRSQHATAKPTVTHLRMVFITGPFDGLWSKCLWSIMWRALQSERKEFTERWCKFQCPVMTHDLQSAYPALPETEYNDDKVAALLSAFKDSSGLQELTHNSLWQTHSQHCRVKEHIFNFTTSLPLFILVLSREIPCDRSVI